ncbi:MAG: methyltransferase domain-containing protein [Planctomycetes bacterium]|nr:methyltransferase domain-containing protein [Planctomycetota bacterium]
MAHEPRGDDYLLGTDSTEESRLGFQHRVWGSKTFELWDEAGFGLGDHILDLGCGPGFASLDLAYLVGPRGRVLSVDASPRYLESLRRKRDALELPQIETLESDVHALDLEPASLDGAFARWVLCFVADPDRVVANVARALRPGAPFVVLDYYRYTSMALSPRSAVMERVALAVEESWRRAGGSLDIGGEVRGLFARHGLDCEPPRGGARVAKPGSALWQWPRSFFRTYLPKLVEMELITAADAAEFERDFDARERDPNAFFLTPPVWGFVGRKRK